MIRNTETDLHTLLDSLTDGEHVKATWAITDLTVTAEGAVMKVEDVLWCDRPIRWEDGSINRYLTSLEVTREEEVTITRDDEGALHALIDSLENGERITAEWRDEDGPMTLTGSAMPNGDYAGVRSLILFTLRWDGHTLHPALHSVTARRPVVQRWERDGDE